VGKNQSKGEQGAIAHQHMHSDKVDGVPYSHHYPGVSHFQVSFEQEARNGKYIIKFITA